MSITDIKRRIRRSFSEVKWYLQNKENYGHNYKGRQKKLSTLDCRRFCPATSNYTKTSRMLKSELNLNVSRHTICRELKEKKIMYVYVIKFTVSGEKNFNILLLIPQEVSLWAFSALIIFFLFTSLSVILLNSNFLEFVKLLQILKTM